MTSGAASSECHLAVCGDLSNSGVAPSRYPYVATEVLCSEIWSIVDTCVSHRDQLLVPFWETVLDKSAEEMKSRVVMATQFAKVNVAFLSKKPAEVNTPVSPRPSCGSVS